MKNPQIFRSSWAWEYSGYDNAANQLFHTTDDSSILNLTNYADPLYDQLVDDAQAERDPIKQAALYNQSEALLLDKAVVVPLFCGRFQMVVSAKVDQYPEPARFRRLRKCNPQLTR